MNFNFSRKYLYLGLFLIGILVVVWLFPWIRDFAEERTIMSKYSAQADFWAVYSALKENRELIKKNPNNDSAYASLGQGFYGLNGYDDAINALEHAVKIAPNNENYWSFLGKIYQIKKNYKVARDAFTKVIEVSPRRPDFYTQLAWLYYFRLDLEKDKAFDVLKQGLEKFPTDRDILFDITRFYLYDKNEVEFRKYAPRYLKVDPNNELIKKAYEKGFESVYGSDESVK